jgi:DNA-binding NtrC family response regulator
VASSHRHTQTQEHLPSDAHRSVAPHLFLVLVCDRPAEASLRISLRDLDEVVLKRDSAQGARAASAHIERRRLTLTVSDAWMSGMHATLRKVYGCWVLEDAGSKNGTFVGGSPVRRHALKDGDLIELGHTLLLFREDVRFLPGAPAVFTSDEAPPAAPGLTTLSPALAAEFARMHAVARSRISVVIEGETGTGKEMVASAIHALSRRRGPFVAVNCGALSPSLIQSELFGYLKGAFPGASEDKPGIIQSADGGTLFLDQVGDLAPASQPLLLRVLQEGEISPIGAVRPVKVDVRVVAASDRDLRSFAPERFRVDLLARLSGIRLVLPPLRDRREDLGLLIREVVRRQTDGASGSVSFTCEAARALLLYPWPLNVRELEKALQPALMLAGGGPVGVEHLPAGFAQPLPPAAVAKPPPPPAAAKPSPPPPPVSGLEHFIDELWRRKVVRVVVAYAVAMFGALQGMDIIVTRLSLPPQLMTGLVIATLLGLPVAAGLAWVFDWTRGGIVRTPRVEPGQQMAAPTRGSRKLLLFAAVLGVLVLVAAGGALWLRHRPAPPIPPTAQSR